MMITVLISNFFLLLDIILHLPQITFLSLKTLIKRIRSGYYRICHHRTFDGVYGSFGAGKTTFVADYVLKKIKKYGNLDCRILSNVEFSPAVLKKYGITPDKIRMFSNVDDISWLLETKVDEKGKKVPAFSWGLFIIDEASTVVSSRDIMNSKKGKGVVTKDFLSLTHQLRKFNVHGLALFQDDGIDIALRRIMDRVFCPHMHCFDRLNVVKVYRAKSIFAYLDDPNSPPPQYLKKFMFVPTDEVYNFFDTYQLVDTIAEGDYFKPNDKDLPAAAVRVSNSSVSLHETKRSLGQKLFGNKEI